VRLTVLLTAGLQVILFSVSSLQAHDEPVKTAAEKTEREKARLKMERLSIDSQEIWVVTPRDSGKANDSTLYVRNGYDRGGNLTEQWVFEGGDSALSLSLYDKGNEWLEEVSFQNDTLVDRTVFIYDHSGLIEQIRDYDNQGRIAERLDYSRPAYEDVIYVEKRNASDSLVYTILYTYEPGGEFKRLLETRQSNPDGSLMIKARNRFNHDFRIEKRVYGKDDSLSHSFSYTYTASVKFDRIVKRTTDDKVVTTQSFEYRDDGLVSKMIEYDGFGAIKRTLCYSYRSFNTSR
jgi:hypothetical protein